MLKEGGPPSGLISYLNLFIVGNPQKMATGCVELAGGGYPSQVRKGGGEGGTSILREGGNPPPNIFQSGFN